MPAKKEYVTFMYVPDNAQSYQFRMNRKILKVTGILLGFLMMLIIFGAVSYWKVAGIALRATMAEMRNEELEEERKKLIELAEILKRNGESERQIRKLAGGIIDFKDSKARTSEPIPFEIEKRMYAHIGLRLLEERETGAREESRNFLRAASFMWPVHGWITKEFDGEATSSKKKHLGIDIASKGGIPVKASAHGVVNFSGWISDFGNMIIIDHGNGFITRYGHNSRVLVEKGDIVKQGKTISFVGSSGRSSAPHLHFEIWKDGVSVNPRDYLLR